MKFFPPELYLRVGADDDAVAVAAASEWERACHRYRKHLKKIFPELPESLRKFLEEQELHEAQVVGPANLSMTTIPWSSQDVVIITDNRNTLLPEQQGTMAILQYAAAAVPIVIPSELPTAFSRGPLTWLHDEVDILEPGVYSHNIQLSDGRIVSISFREFRYQIASLILHASAQSSADSMSQIEGQPARRPKKAVSA
jgi:hypothetical protein